MACPLPIPFLLPSIQGSSQLIKHQPVREIYGKYAFTDGTKTHAHKYKQSYQSNPATPHAHKVPRIRKLCVVDKSPARSSPNNPGRTTPVLPARNPTRRTQRGRQGREGSPTTHQRRKRGAKRETDRERATQISWPGDPPPPRPRTRWGPVCLLALAERERQRVVSHGRISEPRAFISLFPRKYIERRSTVSACERDCLVM